MSAQNGAGTNPPAILKKPGSVTVPNSSKSSRRAAQPRLKFVIRRLPPGLTHAEFESLLGSEWAVGKGRVDWADFHPGKISKEQGKPSRPATAYLHLTDSAHITTLADHVKEIQFLDAKNTGRDSALVGPPFVEFALNPKVPQNRNRKDPRQGTIDQDPEFIAFLESLTNPIQKPHMDLEASLHKDEKITTTPLIEHLREKKAAKERPSKSSGKDSREQRKRRKKEAAASSSDKVGRQSKAEQPAKDNVKVLSRQATATNVESEKRAGSPSASAEKRRERGSLNIAAKIQRDLGIGPAASRRALRKGSEHEASNSAASVPSKDSVQLSQTTTAAASRSDGRKEGRGRDRDRRQPKAESSKADATDGKPVTLPVILKKQPEASSAASSSAAPQSPTATQIQPNAVTGSSVRRAFIKHVNSSQGITETLLEAALSVYGTVLKVEIDRKKGTAWAEFEDPASLTAAIKAGKVEVGNGVVQVSNFRERPTQSGGGRGAAAKVAAQASQTSQSGNPASGGSSGRPRGSRGGKGRARGGGGGSADTSNSVTKDSTPASASK